MNCFRHQDRQAVAICRNCGKATCPLCATDSTYGIACSSQCVHELSQGEQLDARLRQSFGVGTRPPVPASVPTYFFFGLILTMTGIYLSFTNADIDYVSFAMAGVFFVMSATSYKRYRDSCPTC